MRRVELLLGLLVLLLGGSPAFSQGLGDHFVNFEAPSHKPITVVDVGGTDYLLIANAPDNAVEVYETDQHRFLFRVPVGQRPITVVPKPLDPSSNAQSSRVRQIYVANWLGDSITTFELRKNEFRKDQDHAASDLSFRLKQTTRVGDEPTGLAFVPRQAIPPELAPTSKGGLLVVTFSGVKTAWGIYSAESLRPIADSIELLNLSVSPAQALREPRAVAFSPVERGKSQLWILNFRGGSDPTEYDFDLWGSDDLADAIERQDANLPVHGNLGSTNFNMAFEASGDLWVVGQQARNKDLSDFISGIGEPIHRRQVIEETGFIVSFLARYRDLDQSGATLERLDLNDLHQGSQNRATQAEIAITQPTDLVIYGDRETGPPSERQARRIFVTGFNSDTLAVVEPTSQGPETWEVLRLDVGDPTNAFSVANPQGIMRGPRGLALKSDPRGRSNNDRLYIYNRVSQSVTVVDPNFTAGASAVLDHFSLQGQVEPERIPAGRKFLYSSRLQGNSLLAGNVSCASCHIDGNTDYLAWNLSDCGAVPGEDGGVNPILIDPRCATPEDGVVPLPGADGPNAAIKGPMVTQTLRGLVNFEVANDTVQDEFFSNRPYHWRGDKGTFEHFNAAFVNLMGMENVEAEAPNGAFNRGISEADMRNFRDFTFSIHYPPNPEQPLNRRYSGSMFNQLNQPRTSRDEIAQINDPDIGSGAQWGLKLFHVIEASTDLDPRTPTEFFSCATCHSLPDGSNNRLTEFFFHGDSENLLVQGIETAQLKGLALKERRLIRVVDGEFQYLPSPASNSLEAAVSHEFGMLHTGRSTLRQPLPPPPDGEEGLEPLTMPGGESINDFISNFTYTPEQADASSLYMREFDTGVAPIIGSSVTIDARSLRQDNDAIKSFITLAEEQVALANAGLAVHVQIGGQMRGFWYDLTRQRYREEPQPGLRSFGDLTRDRLLSLATGASRIGENGGRRGGDRRLTFVATPLGSERRVARVQGGLPENLPGDRPTAVELLPSPTINAYADVPKMRSVWEELILNEDGTGNFFLFTGPPGFDDTPIQILYQLSLVHHAPEFGLDRLRHEAARRFRVRGDGIEPGAFLRLYFGTEADITSAPEPGQAPTTTPTPESHPLHLVVPIYPARDAGGELVWETAVELDPLLSLFFANGGLANPAVLSAFNDPKQPIYFDGDFYTLQSTDLFQPRVYNFHYVEVLNQTPSGTKASDGSWQRFTLLAP